MQILPVSISKSFNLTEFQRISIFGILFPLVRMLVLLLSNLLIYLLSKLGMFEDNLEQKKIYEKMLFFLTNLIFNATTVFCMITGIYISLFYSFFIHDGQFPLYILL